MKYYSQYLSHDLFELQDSLSGLSKSNRWVKLADNLPWDKIEKEYNKHLRNRHNGAGNKPARMVVGAFIVKHVETLSDEKTIQAIQENPYMQSSGRRQQPDRPVAQQVLRTLQNHEAANSPRGIPPSLYPADQEKA